MRDSRGTLAGHNTVSISLDECVLREHYATPSGFVSIPAGSAELPPGCINATTTATAIRGEIETTVNASNGPETFLRNHLDGVLDTIFDGQGILICDP